MAPKRSKKSVKSKAKPAVNSDQLLPTCEGPKLGRFEHSNSTVQFVALLSAETPGEDGQVFEVIINSKHYALKMANLSPVMPSLVSKS